MPPEEPTIKTEGESSLEGQNLIDAEYLEAVLSDKAAILDTTAESLDSKVNNLAKKDPKKADRTRGILDKKSRRFLSGLKIAGIFFIAGAANYERTRYGVEENLNPDKSITYVHKDEETTKIIEYLSGREGLDKETRFNLARAELIRTLEVNALEYPEELKTVATEEELFATISSMAAENESKKVDNFINYLNEIIKNRKGSQDWIERGFFIPARLDRSDDIYNALWRLEQLTGNPRIRWLDSNTGNVAYYINSALGAKNIAMYDALSNTILIKTPLSYVTVSTDFPSGIQAHKSVSSFIAEVSHAKQFHENQVSAYAKSLRDVFATLLYTFKTQDLNKAYGLTYQKPGGLEHEAHSVIEPELRKEFNKDLKPKPMEIGDRKGISHH